MHLCQTGHFFEAIYIAKKLLFTCTQYSVKQLLQYLYWFPNQKYYLPYRTFFITKINIKNVAFLHVNNLVLNNFCNISTRFKVRNIIPHTGHFSGPRYTSKMLVFSCKQFAMKQLLLYLHSFPS